MKKNVHRVWNLLIHFCPLAYLPSLKVCRGSVVATNEGSPCDGCSEFLLTMDDNVPETRFGVSIINHLDKCRGYCIHWPYSRWYRLGLSSHDCITNIIILIILKVKVNVHVTREVELSLLDHAAFNVEKPLNVIIWFILCYLPPLTIYLSQIISCKVYKLLVARSRVGPSGGTSKLLVLSTLWKKE